MGVKCRNEWEMESGQMVIDKKRHLDVMLLVRYMMEHHDFVSCHTLTVHADLDEGLTSDELAFQSWLIHSSGSNSQMAIKIYSDLHS